MFHKAKQSKIKDCLKSKEFQLKCFSEEEAHKEQNPYLHN